MASELLLETPGRGRSRLSKALPSTPRERVTSVSPKSKPRFVHSPLPPLPSDIMSAPITIPRRPVGSEEVEHSKAPSIASLSSDYSRSPGLSRSSTASDSSNTGNSKESSHDSNVDSAPPLPPKDEQRRQQRPRTPQQQQTHILASPAYGFGYSPAPTELWRRRSEKSIRSITFPDLKLERSNGSTASPPSRKEQSIECSLPAIPFTLSRGLQGRKPIPSRPAPPQPQPVLMGGKLTKLKEKHSKPKLNELESMRLGEDGGPIQNENKAPTSSHRLPTPEYLKTDKNIAVDTVVALSPAVPTTPPFENTRPDIPRRSDSRPTTSTNGSINSLLPGVSLPTSTEDFLSAHTTTTTTTHSRDTSDTLTITSTNTQLRTPQPTKIASTKIPTPQLSRSPTSPLSLSSPIGLYTFPKFPSPTYAPGTVFPPPPITIVQMDCYQAHRFMRSNRNTMCPVACMICQRRDTEIRWRCSWCCLSACTGCMQLLAQTPGKDLRVVMERLGKPIIA